MTVVRGTEVRSGVPITITNLSKTFGMPLLVERTGERFTARAA